MSRFNSSSLSSGRVARTPNTTNLAGGAAFKQDAELELASLMTTSLVQDQYYRSADAGLVRMRELVTQVDPIFAAKAAVYVRNTDGLRSITHAVAAELAHSVKGEQWTKDFLSAVVRRPDDATEILAYYMQNFGKPIPNSLKKGLSRGLGKFDEYQIAKWAGKKNGLSLVDAVNLIHPHPSSSNEGALQQLVNGELVNTKTWEAKLSAAGTATNVAAAKEEAWQELLLEGRLGYTALLRNLRNISIQAPDLLPLALQQLTDPKLVAKSLVLPFQFMIALQELHTQPRIVQALSNAIDLSLANIPDLGERVLIAVDGSGSMTAGVNGNETLTRKGVGSLFAAALFNKCCADVVVFGSSCGPVRGLNPADSTLTNANRVNEAFYGHNTNFHAIFDGASRGHDTVVIFSDMQAWVNQGYGVSHPAQSFANYKRRFKVQPKVFAFDLAGYGSAQFPEKDVFQLAGFSEKSVALIAKYREDPRALVTAIKAVKF